MECSIAAGVDDGLRRVAKADGDTVVVVPQL
jgi:hypothetical protein